MRQNMMDYILPIYSVMIFGEPVLEEQAYLNDVAFPKRNMVWTL